MPGGAYYREWRQAHPEYKERERKRSRARQKRGRGDRSKEYKRRWQKKLREDATPDGSLTESSIVRRAKELVLRVKRPDIRTCVYDDCYEDLVGVCVLALCEGKDPEAAMKAWMTERRKHARLWAPLFADR